MTKKKQADAPTPAQKIETITASYQPVTHLSTREEKIRQRRESIPEVYRRQYDLAVSGRSRRAAVNSFCLECTGWQREEIRLCTGLACPHYPVRPYQEAEKTPATAEILSPEPRSGPGGTE